MMDLNYGVVGFILLEEFIFAVLVKSRCIQCELTVDADNILRIRESKRQCKLTAFALIL